MNASIAVKNVPTRAIDDATILADGSPLEKLSSPATRSKPQLFGRKDIYGSEHGFGSW